MFGSSGCTKHCWSAQSTLLFWMKSVGTSHRNLCSGEQNVTQHSWVQQNISQVKTAGQLTLNCKLQHIHRLSLPQFNKRVHDVCWYFRINVSFLVTQIIKYIVLTVNMMLICAELHRRLRFALSAFYLRLRLRWGFKVKHTGFGWGMGGVSTGGFFFKSQISPEPITLTTGQQWWQAQCSRNHWISSEDAFFWLE